jgi:hypothetical protein
VYRAGPFLSWIPMITPCLFLGRHRSVVALTSAFSM